MEQTLREKFIILFLFLLGLFLLTKRINSELYFLSKLLLGSISLSLSLAASYIIVRKTPDFRLLVKKLLISIFFSLSFFLFLYVLSPNFLRLFLEQTTNGGVVLFIIYMAFFKLFKLDLNLNSIFALISLCLIPIYALGNLTYGAETFAVLSFLLLLVSGFLLIMDAKESYANK